MLQQFNLGKNMSLCGMHVASKKEITCFTVWNGRLVTGSCDSTICLWSKELKCVRRFEGHRAKLSSLRIWDSKMQLISSSFDGSIKFWNEEGECVDTWKHIAWMYCTCIWKMNGLATNTELEYICSGSCNGTLKIWNSNDIHRSKLINCSRDSSNAILIHNNKLWSGFGNGTIIVWDQSYEIFCHRKAHSSSVNSLCTWNNYVVSGGSDGIVNILDEHIHSVLKMDHGGSVLSVVTWYGNLFSASSAEIKGWRADGSCMTSISTVHSFSCLCVWNHFLWAGTATGTLLAFCESRPWLIVRLLWLAHLKEDVASCDLAKLPKDMIKLIAEYVEEQAWSNVIGSEHFGKLMFD